MAASPVRRHWLIGIAAVAVALACWIAMGRLRGPALAGYTLREMPLVQNVVATGRIAAPSRVQVGAEIGGLVLERKVVDGDHVDAGQLLVVLRADDLLARRDEARAALRALQTNELPDAKARLRQARAELVQAERELARRRDLGARQLIARESVEQAAQAAIAARAAAEQARLAVETRSGGALEAQLRERLAAAEAQLARTRIRAAVAGTVLTREVEPGDSVTPGQVLLEIARDDPGELLLPLDEKNLALLQVGQAATCIADAFPDRPFRATVHHIAPGIDPARGTVDVRLRIDPAVDFVREDMTVTATLLTGARAKALAVPNDALLDASPGSDRAQVLRVRKGRVQRAQVRLGLRGMAMTEVVEGLAAGDQVLAASALDATALPADGNRVRVAPQDAPVADRSTHGELPVKFD